MNTSVFFWVKYVQIGEADVADMRKPFEIIELDESSSLNIITTLELEDYSRKEFFEFKVIDIEYDRLILGNDSINNGVGGIFQAGLDQIMKFTFNISIDDMLKGVTPSVCVDIISLPRYHRE